MSDTKTLELRSKVPPFEVVRVVLASDGRTLKAFLNGREVSTCDPAVLSVVDQHTKWA